ncbi:MAG: sprT domain-containing protein [Bacteroidia bacterium]|nr:sprT domain-containing protein [Bacteroidia bacterium]
MTKAELTDKIRKFVPPGSEIYVVELLVHYKVQLKLNKPRSSKFGDYRSPGYDNKFHRITVNKDLNPYSFLITFLHEIAHLTAFEKYKNSIDPHGKEWKSEFKTILQPVVHEHILPVDILHAVRKYMHDPAASSCSDANLMKVLSKYDFDNKQLLEQISIGTTFKLDSGRIFVKGKKLRSWYLCIELPSKKEYKVSGISKVEVLEIKTDL